jgi:large subunit ribosomal protein L25
MAPQATTRSPDVTVHRRTAIGTRAVRRLRREGRVPGVVYGRNIEPLAVAVPQRDLLQLLHARAGEQTLVTLRLAEDSSWNTPALIHAVQQDAVDGQVRHVDFHAILLTEQVKIKIPILLRHEPAGVKEQGGILEHFLREVEVECLPTDIPAPFELDVSALRIGGSVHVRDLAPPGGVRIASDPDGVIASVHPPKAERLAEEAPAAAEPEVIRERKAEAEAPSGEGGKGEAQPEAKKDTKPETKRDTKA